eukprot:355057-Chlamydomonas_euryale.AAC.2
MLPCSAKDSGVIQAAPMQGHSACPSLAHNHDRGSTSAHNPAPQHKLFLHTSRNQTALHQGKAMQGCCKCDPGSNAASATPVPTPLVQPRFQRR